MIADAETGKSFKERHDARVSAAKFARGAEDPQELRATALDALRDLLADADALKMQLGKRLLDLQSKQQKSSKDARVAKINETHKALTQLDEVLDHVPSMTNDVVHLRLHARVRTNASQHFQGQLGALTDLNQHLNRYVAIGGERGRKGS